MEGKGFAKMAKDLHLIDKKLASPDVDLAFTKVKVNNAERKIGYKQFLMGLEILAEKKGCSME